MTITIVNTNPEEWFGGAWQAQSSDGWKSGIHTFKLMARLSGLIHQVKGEG